MSKLHYKIFDNMSDLNKFLDENNVCIEQVGVVGHKYNLFYWVVK